MLSIQQRLNLEAAVRAATTAPSASNPITTAAEVTAAQAAVAALQPWEEVSNVVQVKSAFGASGVKVGVPVTVVGGSASGYSYEANVAWSTDHWVNGMTFGSDLTTGCTATGTNTEVTKPASAAIDDNAGSTWRANSGGDQSWEVDLGTAKSIDKVSCVAAYTSTYLTKIEGTNNQSTYYTLWSGSTDISTLTHFLTSGGSYRWVRLSLTKISAYTGLAEVSIYSGEYQSSTNKITSTDLCGGNTYSFDPNTLHLHSTAGGTSDVTANCAIEYSTDNQVTWSSQYTVTEFKNLSKSLFAAKSYLHLRFQLTGSQTLGYVTLTTDATSGLITKAGNVTITGDLSLDDATLTGDLNMDTSVISLAQATTTDATPTVIKSIALASDKAITIDCDIIANKTGTTTKEVFRVVGAAVNNSGTVALSGDVVSLKTEGTLYGVTLVPNNAGGTKYLDVTVTGASSTTLAWSAKITYNIA